MVVAAATILDDVILDDSALVKEKMDAAAEQPSSVQPGDLMEVVGGASRGGIVVREGKDTSSAEADQRLATGSFISVLDCQGERLCYELMSGSGPSFGWISLKFSGKALVAKAGMDAGLEASKRAEAALRWYSQRVKQSHSENDSNHIRCGTFPLAHQPTDRKTEVPALRGADELRAEVLYETAMQKACARKIPDHLKNADSAEDSDGESVPLCRHCCLPLGSQAYASGKSRVKYMHGECMAQVMLTDGRRENASQKKKEREVKHARREEYDIGWKVDMIPKPVPAADKLGCEVSPDGMVCVVLEGDDALRVAPTFEPAAALNLEYLALALRVRRADGREPLFSLDPADPSKTFENLDPEASMQLKRFEPEWLAGTSVGEVMFQADYHLKELSMGEFHQPVVGMRSSFEYSEAEGHVKEWNAREWFVVRQAEIQRSADDVIIPNLKMGVEAREQFRGANGMEDAPLTRPDHPLVKYAEAFTEQFDLIAERKSVIFQLREVAKASIMAKFMMECGIDVDQAWFNLSAEPKSMCCLEVPQLWNERCVSKIKVLDGTIVKAGKEEDAAKTHGVYGGVDFGIDRFRLAAPTRLATSVVAGRATLGRPSSTLMMASQAGLGMAPLRQFSRLMAPTGTAASMAAPSRLAAPLASRPGISAPLSAAAPRLATSLMAAPRWSMAPARMSGVSAPRAAGLAVPLGRVAGLAAPLTAMASTRPASTLMAATSRLGVAAPTLATSRLAAEMPRGVDLNLDKFNLSAAEAGSWAGNVQAPIEAQHLAIKGETFWSDLADDAKKSSLFSEEDRKLFSDVFNPRLSDRRMEGDRFVPPPTSPEHMQQLRALIKAESELRQQRKELFFSSAFSETDFGPLFPMTWSATMEISDKQHQQPLQQVDALRLRPELLSQSALLSEALSGAAPRFHKCTEDGTGFLIFKLGSLEVRAVEENNERTIGAVFSRSVETHAGRTRPSPDEKILKVTEYIEPSVYGRMCCQYYVVFQTVVGSAVMSERLADGSFTWQVSPEIDERNSQAKVLRSACVGGRVTLGEMQSLCADGAQALPQKSTAKRYAHMAFSKASGEKQDIRSA